MLAACREGKLSAEPYPGNEALRERERERARARERESERERGLPDAECELREEPHPGNQELRYSHGAVAREDVENLLVGYVVPHCHRSPNTLSACIH